MRNNLLAKGLVIVIILLFIGVSVVPSITGNISKNKNEILQLREPSSADHTITDYIGDVCSVDFITQETNIVTYHPDIEVDNLDAAQATYTQQGTQVILTLQVVGNIENRGKIYNENVTELNLVEYDFQVTTSQQDYSISYCNQTGQLSNVYGTINLTSSDFSVVGDTLTIIFSLINSEEIYENLSATSLFLKANLSGDPANWVYLSDIAPNPPLEIMEAYAPNIGSVGEIIQFNGSVVPLTGLPPYMYHWDFGDQGTSTLQNPTHVYTKVGVYIYTFTVTDSAGETANESGTITIQGENELIKAILFGRFTNMITEGDYITVNAINLRMISFKPFEFLHFIDGEQITFSNQYSGIIIGNHFLFGLFNVLSSAPPHTPNIACTTDSTTNRLIVATADVNIKWRDIMITTDNNAVSWRVYSAGGIAVDAWNHTNGAGLAEVIAGDYIQLQFNVTTPPTNVRVTFKYIPTNALLGTWTVNV